MSGDVLLRATDVVKHFSLHASGGRKKSTVHAVDQVSLELRAGEALGLVGESGCGKSTLGRCLLGLIPVTSGTVEVAGTDISALTARQLRPLRREMQMVFQDPYASLNPRKRVDSIVGLSLRAHTDMSREQVRARVTDLLTLVGLDPEHAHRYPHEFSGGQRQRIGIARALAPSPKLIVADEPVSALDVSIQAQIVNLFADLRERLGLAFVFIAHDLSVVRQISNRIAVMYLGKIVESGATEDLISAPGHPYTAALLSSVPSPVVGSEPARKRVILQGDPPSPISPPSGCRFHPRCTQATAICREQEPPLTVNVGSGRALACHHPLT
jgi:peptide/nickel transport system ATP-binding protein